MRTAFFVIRLWVVFLILGITTSVFAQERIVHVPVNSAAQGKNILIEAKIENTTARVAFMKVYFKTPNETNFRQRNMAPDGDRWIGIIPAKDIQGDKIQYFLSAFLSTQVILTFPETNPYNMPEEITLIPPAIKPSEQAAPGQPSSGDKPTSTKAASPLLILSPEQNEILAAEDVIFSVSLTGETSSADSSSVRLFLDDRDVTRYADISTYMATYTPPRLDQGKHRFKIVAKNARGQVLPTTVVDFAVIGAALRKEFTDRPQFHGNAFTDLRQENVHNFERGFAMTGGGFSGLYGKLQYEGGFFFTSIEDRHYQPRNRFHFSLKTEKAGVTGGDSYPRYNRMIMWGRRVRGISGYLRLGFFNLEAVYGQTNRKVNASVSTTAVLDEGGSPLQTATGEDSTELNINRYGTFSQSLLGIRPSFGSGRQFQLGITLAKIKDDISSIKYGRDPKDNLVLGPDLKLAFDRGRLIFEATGAFSLITNDITSGALTADDLKEILGEDVDIGIDPSTYSKWLIINDSTVPLNPATGSSIAYDVSLKLNYFHNLLKLGYKSIGGAFHSLANTWLRTAIQGLYFSDRIRLFQNKVHLTLGYEDLVDNYGNFDANPEVTLKTLHYAVSIYPGPGYPYLNVSMRDHTRDNGIDKPEEIYHENFPDSLIYVIDERDNQFHRDFSFQLGYQARVFDLKNTINLNIITTDKKDKYADSRSYLFSSEFSTDIRMISLTTEYNAPFKTTVSFASNENMAGGGSSNFTYNMFSLGGEYRFLQDRISVHAEYRSTAADGKTFDNSGNVSDYSFSRNHYRVGGLYQIGPGQTIVADANILVYDGAFESYTDQIFRLRYERFF